MLIWSNNLRTNSYPLWIFRRLYPISPGYSWPAVSTLASSSSITSTTCFFKKCSWICSEFYLTMSWSFFSSSGDKCEFLYLELPWPPVKVISCDPEISICEMINCNFSATYSRHSKRSLSVNIHWYSRFSLILQQFRYI